MFPFIIMYDLHIIRVTVSKVLQESAESQQPRGHLDPQSFANHIEFHTYLPPDGLSPFLEHFWTLAWHDLSEMYYSEQVMHRPSVDLFISEEESGIQGTFRTLRTYTALGNGRIIGARFLPGAFHVLWPGAMSELQDGHLSLKDVLPEIDTAQLLALDDTAAIVEIGKILQAHLPAADENVATINRIIRMIEEGEAPQTVTEIARVLHKSERWLQQLFQEYVGVGLKWMLQRHKLLAAARAARETKTPDWSTIAYDLGYSSQQHFNTDFKRIIGKTPLQYKKSLESHRGDRTS